MPRLMLLLLALVVSSAQASSVASSSSMSPVTRVVKLLKALAEKIEGEQKAEEKLYWKFVCWGKKIIDEKTLSNQEASQRIDYLETYIADIEAGRIEFTSERTDLEKEIAQLNEDIEIATGIREKEAADFEMAKDEMTKAINALTGALEVLRKATKNSKTGVMLTGLRARLGEKATSQAEASALSHAIEMGEKFLTRGDAYFLRKMLTGDVPEYDWKKLNRKATFKMSYKARSFKIQDVLDKLLQTFKTNLDDASSKEQDAIDTFTKLTDAKTSELDAAKEALLKMEKETGAAQMSKSEAEDELKDLKKQVADDGKYIEQTKKALEEKKTEYKERASLQTNEIAAINKAIAILYSDDARDTFKKSFESQGFMLLQEASENQAQVQRRGAAATLRDIAHRSKDQRVASIVATLVTGGHFDDVIKSINSMLTVLKDEEKDDLATKEECEKDRSDDSREAIQISREMDEMTEAIMKLDSEIAEIKAEIKSNEKTIAETEESLADAKKIRDEEQAEYEKDKKDDADAKSLVLDAQGVLEAFYKDNNLMLSQVKKASAAPPPPPTTWSKPYGGATEESTGIIAILGMIAEDIQKDIDKATAENDKAIDDYKKTKKNMEDKKKEREDLNNKLASTQSDKEKDRSDTITERGTKQDGLDVVMKRVTDAEPGCNYFTINYAVRAKDRQIEIDGLLKAKAILAGGKFEGLPDPDREIKPGDALMLQRSLRGHK